MTQIKINLFGKHPEITKMMHSMDMDDNGMKIFGCFNEGVITTKTTQIDETYINGIIQCTLAHPDIYYAECMGYFCFKDENIKMFSLGTKFIWVDDMRKQLLEQGEKELKYDKDFIAKQKTTV